MTLRKAQLERKSKETHIKTELNIDGRGDRGEIKTGIPFLDHMLELFSFHGLFDLDLEVVKSDTEIDIHHTNEDIGIVLGKVFKQALADKAGICRMGHAAAPMEATVARVIIDLSGRGYSKLNIEQDKVIQLKSTEEYSLTYLEHFLESFAYNLGATLSVTIENISDDVHTNVEAVFKALGIALDEATQIDPRREGIVPSTKGIID
jgi:imidazoleglycerol-phosphate dehydratase